MAEQRFDDRCPGCFEEKGETPVCPHCGYDESQQRSPLVLPHRTLLSSRYLVGHVLGKPGGFGITYLGLNTALEELVAVKEYLPRELAARETDQETVRAHSDEEAEQFQYGLDRFMNEAQMLAQFDHANIVSVREFFEDNGTAYLVMDYYEGKSLKQYLDEQPEGRMDPEVGTEVMLRVLDGLREVHAEGYLHRDIKPDNIYLTEEGRPILIDFGAARLALGEKSRSFSVVMTEGYAPYEQYRREGDQGPWTDVYGCGATLYRMITGERPPAATDRVVEDTLRAPHEVNPGVPEGLSRAITDALAPGNKERTSTAAELQEPLQNPAEKERGEDETEAGAPPDAETRTVARGGEGREVSSEERLDDDAPEEGGRVPGDRVPGDLWEGLISPLRRLRGRMELRWYSTAGGLALAVVLGVLIYVEVQEIQRRSQVNTLVAEARALVEEGQLGRNGAYGKIQRVLKIDPGNEEAKQLRSRIAKQLAERGAEAREEGNLQAAVGFFERSLKIENRSGVREELEAVRSRLQQKRQERFERLLSEVRSTLNQDSPSAERLQEATAAARDAKKLRPESGEAKKLLGRIASRAEELGQDAEASLQYGEAVRYYQQSLEIRENESIQEKLKAARASRTGRSAIRALNGNEGDVEEVEFSPDGSMVATGGADGTAKLWDVPEEP